MAADPTLSVGDYVAWSHDFAIYSAATVLVAGAYPDAPRGHISELIESNASVVTVSFDDGTERNLTQNELVRVEEA